MERRAFLQSGVACLTALGVGNVLLGRCEFALASAIGRKYALLIGVDNYVSDGLKGATIDVALQAHLLQQRFGFNPEDVIQLTNQAATRDRILRVLQETFAHLQSADLLVVHFSGKGTTDAVQQPALLLTDDTVFSLSDLSRWVNVVGTKRVITVLDTCYQSSGEAMQGSLRVRSSNLANSARQPRVENAGLPGLVVSAATADNVAVEVDYPDFSAGRLTYELTRTLWRTDKQSGWSTHSFDGVSSGADRKLLDNLLSASVMDPSIGGLFRLDAAGSMGEVWLGGLAAMQVVGLNPPALLKAANGQLLQVASRQGLRASVRVKEAVGGHDLALKTVLAEQLRVIPRDMALHIGIDHSLSKVERIDAVGALSGLSNVSAKLIGEGVTDYILGKVQADTATHLVAALPDTSVQDVLPPLHYALLTADNQPISTTASESGEAVKTTVKRFTPVVEALYAEKLLGLVENQAASNLAVSIEVDRLTPPPKLFLQQSTEVAQVKRTDMRTLPSLAAGTQLRYRVTNRSNAPLYWILLGWNSRRDSYLVLPPVDKTSAVLEVGTALNLPLRPDGGTWSVRGPIGQAVVYLITSDRPFVQTTAVLKPDGEQLDDSYLHTLPQPMSVIQALLKDLSVPEFESSDSYGVNMDRYAVLPIHYQVA